MLSSSKRFLMASVVALAPLACGAADLVLMNAKIVTVDDRFTIAQALAITGQRIVAVGSNADMQKLAGSQAKTIDLKAAPSYRASSTTTRTSSASPEKCTTSCASTRSRHASR